MFNLYKYKIKIIDNSIIIVDNFKQLLYFDNLLIKIDNIVIKGKDLKILIYEDCFIKIRGIIENVLFEI